MTIIELIFGVSCYVDNDDKLVTLYRTAFINLSLIKVILSKAWQRGYINILEGLVIEVGLLIGATDR